MGRPPTGGRFRDRADAGRELARHLERHAGTDAIVLALPRGGAPVAYEVANSLGLPLDVFLVRKLGTPGHAELAMGAIASGGVRVLNETVVSELGLDEAAIANVSAAEQRQLEEGERRYRGSGPAPDVRGRTVLLVDDGLATGSTMLAAVQAVRGLEPAAVVVAVPVAPAETCERLSSEADEMVCAATPEPFGSVGTWYADFGQTTDDEVINLLERAAAATADR